jgi:hypothetical protein
VAAETKRDADFTQTYQDGSRANNYDCKAQGTCNGKRKRSTSHNVAAETKREADFTQTYQGGSRANNYDCKAQGTCNGKRKRSTSNDVATETKREAQFQQQYDAGSQSINNDCKTSGSCTGGFSHFDQTYGSGSSAQNYDNGKRKRSLHPIAAKKAKRDAELYEIFTYPPGPSH